MNPHFVDYVSEFNNTVNMFMLKPEHEPSVPNQHAVPMRSHPANLARPLIGPPTL